MFKLSLLFALDALGGGFVISPNQTLTLSEVPNKRAGSASGVLQTAQRIGSAAGIAITGSIFYSGLTATHGDFAEAFRHGLVMIVAFVAAALALALADALTTKTGARSGLPATRPEAQHQS